MVAAGLCKETVRFCGPVLRLAGTLHLSPLAPHAPCVERQPLVLGPTASHQPLQETIPPVVSTLALLLSYYSSQA